MESGHVNTRAEAERRRALALKALDQRLAAKPTPVQNRASGSVPLSTSASTGGTLSSTTIAAIGGVPSANDGSLSKENGDVVFDSTEEASATPLPQDKN